MFKKASASEPICEMPTVLPLMSGIPRMPACGRTMMFCVE
jgi:hypothetical protein